VGISEAEFIEISERMRRNRGGKPEPQPKCEDTLEAPIQAECVRILESDGWRPFRTEAIADRSRGRGVGEIGQADYIFIRYGSGTVEPWKPLGLLATGCDVIHIEFKRRRGGVISKAQREWHTRERARGALTLIAGEDFDSSVQGFTRYYKASGLCRRADL